MTPSRRTFLKGAGAAAALAAVGDHRAISRVLAAGKVPITFWSANPRSCSGDRSPRQRLLSSSR